MSEHTPGPWAVRDDGHDYPCPPIDAEAVGRGYYASVAHAIQRDPHPQHGGGISRQTSAANARLIAAAPDLLDALEELADLVDDIRSGGYMPDSFTNQPARAAIAKAKGQA